MPLVHSGNAPAEGGFFLIGQICGPICLIEGDEAQTLIIFTSLLDFAGPRARHFFLRSCKNFSHIIDRR